MRRLLTLPAALLVSLLVAGPAMASQTDASANAAKSGPLVRGIESCERSAERREGVLVAELEVCSVFYSFKPSGEANKRRDFGVVWVQSNVDAAPGWCATKADTAATLDRGRIHSVWPGRGHTADEPKVVAARIVADAEGSAENRGVVRQSFVLFPETLRTFITASTHGGPRGTSAVWTGSSRSKLFFVSAAEVSWSSGTDAPRITPSVDYEILEKETC